MEKFCFLILSLVVFCQCSQDANDLKAISKEGSLKSIKGWTIEAGDTVIAQWSRFDSLGRLLIDSQPWYYCATTYTYDCSDRIIFEETYCGESNGNGTISYKHFDKGYVRYFSGGIHEVTDVVYFDEEGVPIKQFSDYNYLGNFPGDEKYHLLSITRWNSICDSSKRIICSEQRVQSVRTGISLKRTGEIETEANYTTCIYNDFDSLMSRVEINEKGMIEKRTTRLFDEKTRRLTDEFTVVGDFVSEYNVPAPENEAGTHWKFMYDSTGALFLKEELQFCKGKETTQKKTEFKNGLPMKEISSNCDSVYQVIHYMYEYWPVKN